MKSELPITLLLVFATIISICLFELYFTRNLKIFPDILLVAGVRICLHILEHHQTFSAPEISVRRVRLSDNLGASKWRQPNYLHAD